MPQAVLFRAARSSPPSHRGARRQRLLTRAVPIAILAAVAFAIGVVSSGSAGRAERTLVRRYLTAWTHGDLRAMYSLLSPASRRQVPFSAFRTALGSSASTATIASLSAGHILSRHGDLYPVRMTVVTKLFGTLHETLQLPLIGSGSSARVRYSRRLLFPGLRPGETLISRVAFAPRAAILARDGTPLAEGPTRSSPIASVAQEIVGSVGPLPAGQAASYAAQGYPPGATVGLSGLELIFQTQLAGRPGGTLLAGHRVLAARSPAAGLPVTTTIDPTLERAAITAIAGRYAGVVAMDPHTGRLLAVAGVGFSALQPPGSTFKIVTATGVLEAGIAKLTDTYPMESQTLLDGVPLQNANGESCGGTLVEAFAVSCNSVFAPLGAKLGAAALVNVAERFGFNQPWPFPIAAESQIPAAGAIGDSLAVGSSAIGQGRVQTTALGMTDIAATIAMGGQRPIPTLREADPPRFVTVTTPKIADEVQRMMEAVVAYGTGTAAQIPGVKVAGKTGTAELRSTVVNSTDPNAPAASSPLNTDAWFVGYAPVGHPQIVVGALFPSAGAGGATAAPAVHDIIAAALGH